MSLSGNREQATMSGTVSTTIAQQQQAQWQPHQCRRVLVVEQDRALQATLQRLLAEMGYAAAWTSDLLLAEAALRVSAEPLVVLIGHGGKDQQDWDLATDLLGRISQLPPHAYLLLSSSLVLAPVVWNPHTHHDIPVVPASCAVDALLAQLDTVATRAAQLTAARSPSREPDSLLASGEPHQRHSRLPL